MLKLTDQQTGQTIWINVAMVSALLPAKQEAGGSLLLLSGGFEIQVQEEPADVSSLLDKRLNAY